LQQPFHDPQSDWKPPRLSELPDWTNAERVAIDTETRDPQLTKLGPGVRRDGYVVGISFALEGGPAFYLPIRHQCSWDNMDEASAWNYLRAQARAFRGTIVGMNLPYDLDYLAENDVVFRNAEWFRDVGVAAPLIDERHMKYSLDAIAKRAHVPMKDETLLRWAAKRWCMNPKSELWRMPARHVADYAIRDVTLPLELLRIQEDDIRDQDLHRVWDLESRLLPVTVKMRRRGVKIDTDELDKVRQWAAEQEQGFLDRIRHATGVEIPAADINKKQHIAAAIAEIGYELPRTAPSKSYPTGQPKTDADTMGAIDHDVARWYLRAKKFHKMGNDFVNSVIRHMTHGRLHCTLKQIKGTSDGQDDDSGAAYGRTSMSNVNLQQQYNPEKEPEISGRWRKIFLPDDGKLWAACDYSAQEPRMVVHYAAAAGCPGGEEMARKWTENPDMCLHTESAIMIGEPCKVCKGPGCPKCNHSGYNRKDAKTIFLGLAYGMGGGKLCINLGLPTRTKTIPGTWKQSMDGKDREILVAGPEGEALIEKYHGMVPFMRALTAQTKRAAEKRGRIVTFGGRRCRFPKKRGRYDWTHKALNRLIQGSAADQTKLALVKADAAGLAVQLCIHDEITMSVADRSEAERLATIMRECVQLKVPSKVDVEVGPSWGEAE